MLCKCFWTALPPVLPFLSEAHLWSSLSFGTFCAVRWDPSVSANICRRRRCQCHSLSVSLSSYPPPFFSVVCVCVLNRSSTIIDQGRSIATNLVSGRLEPVLFSLGKLNITLFVVECVCVHSSKCVYRQMNWTKQHTHCGLSPFACK